MKIYFSADMIFQFTLKIKSEVKSHFIKKLHVVAGFSQKFSLLNSMPSILNKSMLLKVFMANQIVHLEWAEYAEVHIRVCYKNKNTKQN